MSNFDQTYDRPGDDTAAIDTPRLRWYLAEQRANVLIELDSVEQSRHALHKEIHLLDSLIQSLGSSVRTP